MVHVGGILTHTYVTSKGALRVHWMNFKDPESGIAAVEVGIGSNLYSTDVKPLAHVNGDFTIFPKEGMHDGLRYYVTIKVTVTVNISIHIKMHKLLTDNFDSIHIPCLFLNAYILFKIYCFVLSITK